LTDSPSLDIYRPIESGRVSERIVERFSDAIRIGQLTVGDRLPAERELVAQLSVSRTTVRDALRILEARGLVEIRVGAGGGAFVTAPPPHTISQSLVDMLTLSSLSARDVTELRYIVELGAIPFIAERANQQDIDDLRLICDQADKQLAEGRFDVRKSAEFHVRLARAAHNAALEQMILVFHEPLLISLQRAHASAPTMGESGVAEHRRIVTAIEERDAETASQVMQEHLQRTAARLAFEG
jgi:GntR family transcriptional regulator, transcriptional repressor for pyruvate dehydrogenase complex